MLELKFLGSAYDIAEEMRELFRSHSSDKPIRIAVAFWGQGADAIIRNAPRQYQIICNLKSGGTNPQVVRSLKALANVSIIQLDTLHAKVVITDGGALISSANVSTNGLALEGNDSRTWQEAGVLVPSAALVRMNIVEWFQRLWEQGRRIDEYDLERASLAWAQRIATRESAGPHTATADDSLDSLTLLRTITFSGRPPMRQVYLRSAAAILALGGCAGRPMPAAAFKFLFTTRAFEYHEAKFLRDNGSLKIDKDSVGYFIGADGSISTATKPGRLKSFSDELVHAVARWMMGDDHRPDELEGTTVEARFLLR